MDFGPDASLIFVKPFVPGIPGIGEIQPLGVFRVNYESAQGIVVNRNDVTAYRVQQKTVPIRSSSASCLIELTQ
jgi:hypothetical protein